MLNTKTVRNCLAAFLASFLAVTPGAARQAEAAEDSARTLHLLRRATFGVRPEDLSAVLSMGREAWIDRQLASAGIADPQLDVRLTSHAALLLPIHELMERFSPPMRDARADSAGLRRGRALDPSMRSGTGSPRQLLGELVTAKLLRAVHSERQLEEVMTDFWFNHFNVFFGKNLTRYMIADYEREAIRPHVFGRFEDMLLATARHPAMLYYLDNWTSVAPGSTRTARRDPARGRVRGINENYARELLELHTLGVDGGYSQEDVIAVARAFTGWTFVPPRRRGSAAGGPVTFRFNTAGHDTGTKTVLGTTLPAGRGIEDGEEVIRRLALHPTTARFLAGKLVERFVSDTPDSAFVHELARVYLDSDGDLRAVTRALFTSPRFHDAAVRGTKVKTPFELVASTLRVTAAEIGQSWQLIQTLRALGQLPYTESAPTGFPAASEHWVSSSALLARMNFALEIATGRVDGVRVEPFAQSPLHDASLDRMIAALLPGMPADDLAETIRDDLARHQTGANGDPPLARAVGLVLGSPHFQRR